MYKQFVEHTQLIDGVYKSVFIQIDEILAKIASLRFVKLTYTLEAKNYTWDFADTSVAIPVYVGEIIKNLFENFYTLPSNSCITLQVEFEGTQYIIEAHGEEISIPEDLKFIKQYELSPFFFVEQGVYEPIAEFDRYFKFMDIMSKNHSFLIPELQSMLETENDVKDTIYNTEELSVNELQSIIMNLKKAGIDAKSKIDSLILAQDKLMQEITTKTVCTRNLQSIQSEHDTAQEELTSLAEQYKELANTHTSVTSTIALINAELHNTTVADTSEDTKYLREKCFTFNNRLATITESMTQLTGFMDTLADKLKRLKLQMQAADTSVGTSLESLNNKLTQLQQSISKEEALAASYDAKIRELSQDISTKLTPSKNSVVVDSDVLVSKLATVGYSKPILIVYNYIRNVFAYEVSKLIVANSAKPEYKKYNDFAIIIVQLVSMRETLKNILDLTVQSYFSIVPDMPGAISITRRF